MPPKLVYKSRLLDNLFRAVQPPSTMIPFAFSLNQVGGPHIHFYRVLCVSVHNTTPIMDAINGPNYDFLHPSSGTYLLD